MKSIRFVESFDADKEARESINRDARLLARFKFVSGAPDYTPDKAREVFYRLLNLDMEQRTGEETI